MNNELFQSIQRINEQTKQVQEKLAGITVQGRVGGDLVVISMKGNFEIESVQIDPSLLSPEHKSVLEGMLVSAGIDAVNKVREKVQGAMGNQLGSMFDAG